MEEIWKDVVGYEGLYKVSNLGNVKRLKCGNIKEHIMKQRIDMYGYCQLRLCKNNNPHTVQAHRLVAMAFIENPLHLPEVNHKDEDKTNNSVDNLEWCTYKYNSNYGTHRQRLSLLLRNNKRQSIPIVQKDFNGNVINRFPSAKEAQRQTGFAQTNISKCCRGEYKQAYGYVWELEIDG